jgi:hypothetical protein
VDPSAVPAGFRTLSERQQQWVDPRRLGYFGQGRFVFFYYEPRGEEVVWNDGRTYGFGCGGWMAFQEDVAPLARSYGADMGDERRPGPHVLVVDRELGHAYFADRATAERFVIAQAAA